MKDRNLILRLRRLRDLPALFSLLTPRILLEASGIRTQAFDSLLSFWIWLKMTFNTVYVMEVEEQGHRRIIGFAGLYRVSLGLSVWLSLAVFDPKDRGQGYGQQAVSLLLTSLQETGVATTVFVEISNTNLSSLRFFRKLGFKLEEREKDRVVLETGLPAGSRA
jgi:RimJ/RimL family protein N-acetyltransferase